MRADYGRIALVAGAIASALFVGMIFGGSQALHQWPVGCYPAATCKPGEVPMLDAWEFAQTAQAQEFNRLELGQFNLAPSAHSCRQNSLAAECDFVITAQPSLGPNDPTNTIQRNLETTNKKRDRYQWYDLTPAQLLALTNALKAVPENQRVPVWILCDAVTSCLGIAQDFDTALEDAGWKSDIERPGELVDGLHVTSPALAKIITDATRIPVIVDNDNGALERAAINFGRKRPARQ